MSDFEFKKFPSIKRLNRECVITEKLDGANAQIIFDSLGNMFCGSRKREITPEDDNHGFAKWCYENQESIFVVLGEGRHYGEWWGSGIQRRYGKVNDDKVFSLFNTGRWEERDCDAVEGLSVVPVIYRGDFNTKAVEDAMTILRHASIAAPEFKKPEGIVIYHSQLDEMFKVTYEHDEKGKPFGA